MSTTPFLFITIGQTDRINSNRSICSETVFPATGTCSKKRGYSETRPLRPNLEYVCYMPNTDGLPRVV